MRTWTPSTRCVAPQEIDSTPLNDLQIPLGDAMPKWGLKTMAGKALLVTKDGIMSESGLRFASLCTESSLAMEHTCFKHKGMTTTGIRSITRRSEEHSGDRYLTSRHSEEQMQQVTITVSDTRFA